MAQSVALPSRRAASLPVTPSSNARPGALPRSPRIAIATSDRPPRRNVHRTPSVFIAVEWLVLTALGALAVALATG